MTDEFRTDSEGKVKHKRTAAIIDGWQRDARCRVLFSCYQADQQFMAKARRVANNHRLAIVRHVRMGSDWQAVVDAPDALHFMVDDLRKADVPEEEYVAKERELSNLADATVAMVADFLKLAEEYGLDCFTGDRGVRELWEFAKVVCSPSQRQGQIPFGGRVLHMHAMPTNLGVQDGRGFPVSVEIHRWWSPYLDSPEAFRDAFIEECRAELDEQMKRDIPAVEDAGIAFPYDAPMAEEHIGWLYWRLAGYSSKAIATALAEVGRLKKSTDKAPKWRQVQAATKAIADVIDVRILRFRFDSLPVERFTGSEK